MARRRGRVLPVLSAAAAEMRRITNRVGRELPGSKMEELLHAQLGLAPNEMVVLAICVNEPETPFAEGQVLRCPICRELLTQGNLSSWPVDRRWGDGTTYKSVVPTCDDPDCRDRLFARLEAEDP